MYSKGNLPVLPQQGLLPNLLNTDHYAAVTQSVLDFNKPYRGVADSNGYCAKPQIRYHDRIQVKPTVNMPLRSIVTLNLNYAGTSPLPPISVFGSLYNVDQLVYNASPVNINTVVSPSSSTQGVVAYGYAINEESPIAAGSVGYATLMQPGKPYLVTCDSSSTPTGSQQFVGMAPGSMRINVANARDMILIAQPVTIVSGEIIAGIIWVPWIEIEGYVYGGDIPAATNSSGGTNISFPGVSTGQIFSYSPDSTNTTGAPVQFTNGGWNQQVFNVVNRDFTFLIKDSTYIRIRFMNNEWRVVWAAC